MHISLLSKKHKKLKNNIICEDLIELRNDSLILQSFSFMICLYKRLAMNAFKTFTTSCNHFNINFKL